MNGSLHIPDLAGKRALVTGGSAGIGLSIAEALCKAGCSVAISGRREDQLEGAKQNLLGSRPDAQVMSVAADCSKLPDIDGMVSEVERVFGGIDILVNNAGTNVLNEVLDVTEEEWDRVMNLNLKGLFFCCQRVGGGMVKRRTGTIVNIASQMGLVGYHKRAVYCASKGGVVQLTKVMAIEWAPFGVRVNAVAPTFIETPLTKAMLANPDFREEVMPRIPMGRFAEAGHVSSAVLYLASAASDMVTGHTLPVDGGWVAW